MHHADALEAAPATAPDFESAPVVLIADDDPTCREILQTAMELLEPEVEVLLASDGRQALDLIEAQDPDLIITDLQMPGADGLQILAHLAGEAKSTPVLVVTGHATASLKKELPTRSDCLLLEKPIDPSLVVQLVRQLLNHEDRASLRGFSLPSILQLVEMERKSCLVAVRSQGRVGSLTFRSGQLVQAELGELLGDEAAVETLSLPSPLVEIMETEPGPNTTVSLPLMHLLMEAARLEDDSHREDFDRIEELMGEAEEQDDSQSEQLYRSLLDEVEDLPGFRLAAIVDLPSHRAVLIRGGAHDRAALDLDTTIRAGCRLVQADQALASKEGVCASTDLLTRRNSNWHLMRGLAGQKYLHLILGANGNPALAQFRVARWLKAFAGQEWDADFAWQPQPPVRPLDHSSAPA